MGTGGHHIASLGGWMAVRLAGLALLLGSAVAAAQETVRAQSIEPIVYGVFVNGRPAGDAVLLRLDGQRLFAREEDWQHWQLVTPATRFQFDGQVWYALDDAPGFAAEVDAQRQEARLTFGPRAFAPSVLTARQYERVTPTPPPGLGGFLNYEFFATHRAPDGVDATNELNGLLETGLFNPQGVLTSAWLGRNLTDEQTSAVSSLAGRETIRLETTFRHDDPEDMESLYLGDALGGAGLWGRPVRFGGVRWTRNFSTQPGFVTIPQPALRGETALPSVLDVYVDGLRRQRLETSPGPFVVEDLPTFTGTGEVQVVVRDLLGRETVITDTYITGTQLLKAGLHDWSYEAGAQRERFGVVSDDYGDVFAAGTRRYGFSDAFTGEARLEGSEESVTGGLGGVVAIPGVAIVSNAFAVSHSDAGDGVLDVVTVQHNSRRGISLGARLAAASRHFTQVGVSSMPRRSFSANAGYGFRPFGRFGLGYVNRDELAPEPDFEALTASWILHFDRGYLSLLGIDRKRPSHEYSIGLTLGLSFAGRNQASAGHRHREPEAGGWSSQSYARLQRSLPEQEGWGYRVQVSEDQGETTDSVTTAEAGVAVNARYGSYGLEAATYDEIDVYRATASGGFGTVGGHWFASRKLSRSFAVIETGAEDVVLRVNNQPAARTDADGIAVLPYLQAYQANTIQVDATEVPLDVEVGAGELKAAPYWRSGMLIPLDVRRTRSALVTLVRADGTPVPAGAVARLQSGAEAPVGRNGQVFLTDLAAGDNAVDVRWNGTRCSLTFALPADAGVQPQIGPVTCQ